MNLKKTYIAILALITTTISFAQDSIFDYEVLNPEKGVYEVSFQLYEMMDIKIIQIDLYDGDALMGNHEAIINKKQDNNYYLFFNQEEELVYMDDLKLVLQNPYGKLHIAEQFIEVRLLDSNFGVIDTYRKQIDK